MNVTKMMRAAAAPALLVAMLALQGCSTVSAVNNTYKTVSFAGRIVSSTGDVIFDHDGDGR